MFVEEDILHDLKFDEHTQEKLDEINYYYKTWFGIVKQQKTYIIDAYAGTGYNEIKGENRKKSLGSALLAVDLYKLDSFDNLSLKLINIKREEIDTLEKNIKNYIKNAKIKQDVLNRIDIINADWSEVIEDIIIQTKDGIRLFLLDPYGAKSLAWKDVIHIGQESINKFGYKESGTEILINWAWHTVRRLLGKYYKSKREAEIDHYTEVDNLDTFFGRFNWKQVANKYLDTIFTKKEKDIEKINQLKNELVKGYALNLFDFFRYICIHPVYARLQTSHKLYKERGEIVYYLIFVSNYYDAPKIIATKFREYINKEVYLPKSQSSLDNFIQIKKTSDRSVKKRITINDKIKNLENKLKKRLTTKQKNIIKQFYKRKSQDYGYFEFILSKEIKCDKNNKEFQLLLDLGILSKRQKEFRASVGSGEYYYLDHNMLVNRDNYLYFNENIFKFLNGKLKQVK